MSSSTIVLLAILADVIVLSVKFEASIVFTKLVTFKLFI